jgi:hypothetical protein
MATLTCEQIDLMNQTGGQPLRLVDPATNQEFVLLTAEVYERIHSAVTDLDRRAYDTIPQRWRGVLETTPT